MILNLNSWVNCIYLIDLKRWFYGNKRKEVISHKPNAFNKLHSCVYLTLMFSEMINQSVNICHKCHLTWVKNMSIRINKEVSKADIITWLGEVSSCVCVCVGGGIVSCVCTQHWYNHIIHNCIILSAMVIIHVDLYDWHFLLSILNLLCMVNIDFISCNIQLF